MVGVVLVASAAVAMMLATTSAMASAPARPEAGVEGLRVATAATDVGAWSTGIAMPAARSEIGAAVVEGNIIVTGGLDQSGRSLDSVASYDPAAEVWTRLASMPARPKV